MSEIATREPRPAGAPDHAGVAFHPPLLLLGSLGLGFLARWVAPVHFLRWEISVPLGPAVVAASLGLFVWAVVTMRVGNASIPTSQPTEVIVTRGPYALSRNPIYVAMVGLQLGIGIWTDSVWFLIVAAISPPLLWWGVISREERYLRRKFGAEYVAYETRVRRWL